VDAISLLKSQHKQVLDLFKKYKQAEDPDTKRELCTELADNLAAHCEIEEQIFYPAVYVGEMKDLLKEAVEEHLAAKRTLADILEMSPEDESFDAKMKVLQDQIEHHIEEEEGDLFKRVRASFEKVELEALGEEMERMFEQLIEQEPRTKVPEETDHAPPLA
jgi:hemerythrin superfamily protein